MNLINSLSLPNKKIILPVIEGGKGIGVSNGVSAGAFAKAGAVGTFSAVNADFYDENGSIIPIVYHKKTRRERHHELIEQAIKGGIAQAKIAREISNGNGCIHMNVLWEMGGVEPILEGVLSKVSHLIDGVTCGAGMPYKLAQICASHNVFYYPIVSSARAFNILWRRSFIKFSEYLGGVVYEDPWLAGGHNGLSNSENPTQPEAPYERVKKLRTLMNELSLDHIPIIMAGGVWCLNEWKNFIDNPEIGKIAFQFGTRPLLTKESPISDRWKKKLMHLKKGDILLNRFSPTGFYSSAVRNDFLKELEDRTHHQISYSMTQNHEHSYPFEIGKRKRIVYIQKNDFEKANQWILDGLESVMRTPDQTLIFVTSKKEKEILTDQINCMGCLSACLFSNWSQNEKGTTGLKADPRSFCIQKSLQDIAHNGDVNHNLMFAGHQAYRFAQDPFYSNGFIPSVKELIDRILSGL